MHLTNDVWVVEDELCEGLGSCMTGWPPTAPPAIHHHGNDKPSGSSPMPLRPQFVPLPDLV